MPPPPGARTGGIAEIDSAGARLSGWVDDEGDADGSSCAFEIAAIADSEFASPLATVPCDIATVTGEESVDVSASVAGLTPETGYRYRVEATNRGGTTFGGSETFETAAEPVSPPGEIGSSGGTVIVHGPPDEAEMSLLHAAPGAPAATAPPAAPSVPSNAIRLGPARLRHGVIMLSVVVPGAGTLTVAGGSAARRTKDMVLGADTVTLRVALTKATLRRAVRRRVSLRLRVTFTPTGGTAATKSVALVVGRSTSGR